MGVDVEGKVRRRFTASCGGLDLAHVAGTGEGGQPGAFLEGGGDLVGGEVFVFFQPQHQAGVDGAGAGGL